MLQKIVSNMREQKRLQREALAYQALVRYEARLGGKVFGPIPDNVRREFFCLDANTWVWFEEWTDARGKRVNKTVRYDVRPDSIIKVQDGRFEALKPEEARRLYQAAVAYENTVSRQLYSFA